MVKCIQYPQEVEVYYLIPALRRELALTLKLQGLEQKEIAKLLNITESAVSQYISAKRGVVLEFPVLFKKKIQEIALHLVEKQEPIIEHMQELLKLSLSEGVTCQLHKQFTVDLQKDCNVCFEV